MENFLFPLSCMAYEKITKMDDFKFANEIGRQQR